jgi:hypothetical protein
MHLHCRSRTWAQANRTAIEGARRDFDQQRSKDEGSCLIWRDARFTQIGIQSSTGPHDPCRIRMRVPKNHQTDMRIVGAGLIQKMNRRKWPVYGHFLGAGGSCL